MRASHGINAFNLIHNMPYGSPNLFQNLNQHHHDQTSTLNPYAASRQLGFGCEFFLLVSILSGKSCLMSVISHLTVGMLTVSSQCDFYFVL